MLGHLPCSRLEPGEGREPFSWRTGGVLDASGQHTTARPASGGAAEHPAVAERVAEHRHPPVVAVLGSAVTLYLTADDVDALASRAVGGGATLDRGPEDSDHGRMAVFRDPFGHRWMLGSTA